MILYICLIVEAICLSDSYGSKGYCYNSNATGMCIATCDCLIFICWICAIAIEAVAQGRSKHLKEVGPIRHTIHATKIVCLVIPIIFSICAWISSACLLGITIDSYQQVKYDNVKVGIA